MSLDLLFGMESSHQILKIWTLITHVGGQVAGLTHKSKAGKAQGRTRLFSL